MTRLRSCAGCARHVFVTEQICPFCQTQLPAAPEPVPMTAPSGASRAQRLALAAAISSSTLLGCTQTGADNAQNGSASTAGAAGSRAGTNAPPPGGAVTPVYGAPVPSDPPSGQPGAGQGSVEVPIYGAPVAGSPAADDDAGVPEAGSPAAGSGGSRAEAGKGAAGEGAAGSGGTIAVPVYGAPLPEYGAPPPPKD